MLQGVSGVIEQDKPAIFLGGSGTGKSVLIKILCGLMKHDRGTVEIDGYDISKLKSKDRVKILSNIGFLFQGGALFDSLTIWENIAFRLMYYDGMQKEKTKDMVVEKLHLVGLSDRVLNLYPSELSGGMQKRASLARTIINNPKILFCDEPTTGLDPIMSQVVNNLISKCQKEINSTNVIITHDMKFAQNLTSTVSFLYNGKIIWTGGNAELFISDNEYIQQFVNGNLDGPITL